MQIGQAVTELDDDGFVGSELLHQLRQVAVEQQFTVMDDDHRLHRASTSAM